MLSKQKGLGKAKIASLFALKEICNRIKLKRLLQSNQIDIPSVLELLHLKAIKEVRECFYLITLSQQKSLINLELISRGSLTEVGVHARDIVKHILDDAAKYVIIAHNHPKQSCFPSREDFDLFYQFKNLLDQLDIILMDHLVIGTDGVYSCNEKKNLTSIDSK